MTVLAGACGSSSQKTAATTQAAATPETSATTTAASTPETTPATSAAAPTGTPITLMSIYVKSNPAFSQPETFTGAQARVDAINAAGGINGHPVKLIGCDSNLDPNQEKACIDQAISEHVSAIVSSSIFFTPLTTLEAAKIPFIGAQGITPDQLSSTMSYPFRSVRNNSPSVSSRFSSLLRSPERLSVPLWKETSISSFFIPGNSAFT
jgi:ABC-type sugar transport system substrate-binding protein